MLLFVRFLRVWSFDLRGRAALALAAAQPSMRREMLGEAERAARAIDRDGFPAGPERARLLRAGIAAVRGDRATAQRELESAALAFDALAMSMHAAVARRRLGEVIGGDGGKTMIDRADAWLTEQQIKRPDRWSQMLAPR
jgi:hypothetical protein